MDEIIQPVDVLVTLSLAFDGDYKMMRKEIIERKFTQTKRDWFDWKGKIKSNIMTILAKNYPSFFKDCFDPPMVLFYYGNLSLLEKQHRLTCIGSRNPTIYQSDTSYRMIKECEYHFKNELVIVSGMAQGIDQECMKAAMEVSAPIISIIGSGIDNPYPSMNGGIYDYCKSGKGLILSEYPNKVEAKPSNFLFRNRLLAASSDVVYIGSGKKRSGSATTVKYATELGKDILALPCNCTGDDLTNSLIKDGAIPVLCANDMIEAIENRSDKKYS